MVGMGMDGNRICFLLVVVKMGEDGGGDQEQNLVPPYHEKLNIVEWESC